MLSVSNLHSNYKNISAVKGLNLEVERGKIVTLIGSNGAGKTTTLKTIAGIKNINDGTLIFDGENINKLPAYQRVKRGISLVPEGRGIFTDLTVKENLVIGGYTVRSNSLKKEYLEEQLTLFPVLKERLVQKAGTLSGGEQQMLTLARALISRPKLLLLDEPSMGLAPIIVEKIFDVITAINKSGVTILLVEQNAVAALEISDYAYVLNNGRIVLEGKSQNLQNNPAIQTAYLGI